MSMGTFVKATRYFAGAAAAVALLSSCANIGNPSGGPRDEDPPRFVSANPAPGSVNVKRDRIQIRFDELVNVKDAFTKVVVSPTGKSVPRVSSSGRTVTVQFDSLQPDVTYTIDFADAIEDNNESNKLRDFAYTFSTGPTIDSLRISGMVLSAQNLEPQQGMIVGVEENLADSAFKTIPLVRVAKTDDRGRFTIRGLKDADYRVFALGDRDNDWHYANPEEDIAFYGEIVRPTFERIGVTDTLYTPLGEVDSVIDRTRTRFLPNDILLRSFNSQKRSQYLVKYERMDSTRVFLKFNTRSDSLPRINAIGHDDIFGKSIIERREGNDSIIYWLPKELVKVDSLVLAADYLRTDTLGNLTMLNDTLKVFTNRPIVRKKKKKDKEVIVSPEDSIRRITTTIKALGQSSHEVYEPVVIEFEAPLSKLDPGAFRLEQNHDSVFRPVARQPRIEPSDSLSPRDFKFEYPWEYGGKYRLVADTIAGVDIYGKPSRPFTHEFTVKNRDEYCSLTLNLTGLDESIPAFVDVLGSNDQIVRSEVVRDGTVAFENLTPGKYYVRVTEDYNGNGLFDTGDYDELHQPDLAYYYPKAINIKKNWDKEESWNVFETAIDKMKPLAITKNKPEQPKKGKTQNAEESEYDEEDDEVFDPTVNPFDPNSRNRRNRNGQRRTGTLR